MAKLEMAKSDLQMWKNCHMQIWFFAIWIPMYLLCFDTLLEIFAKWQNIWYIWQMGIFCHFIFFAMIKEITSGFFSFSSSCCTSAIFDVFKLFFKLTFAWLSLIQTWVCQAKIWFSNIEYYFWDLQSTLWSVNEGLSGNLWKPQVTGRGLIEKNEKKIY